MDGDRPEAGTRVPLRFTGRVVAVHRWGVYVAGHGVGGDEPAGSLVQPAAEVVVAIGAPRWPPGPWHLRLPTHPDPDPCAGNGSTATAVAEAGVGAPAHGTGWRACLAPGDPVNWSEAGGTAGRGSGAVIIPPPATWRRWSPPRGVRGRPGARRRAAAVLGHLLAVAQSPGWKPLARGVARVEQAIAAGAWEAAVEAALTLLGAGPGLTPSGDDWLAGWSAYWAWRAGVGHRFNTAGCTLDGPRAAGLRCWAASSASGRDILGGYGPRVPDDLVGHMTRNRDRGARGGLDRGPADDLDRTSAEPGHPDPGRAGDAAPGAPYAVGGHDPVGLVFGRWATRLRAEAARRTGPVSRALLKGALAGELPEPAASLLVALWTGAAAAVPPAARRLFRTGHSSGVDLAWGLWMAARMDAG